MKWWKKITGQNWINQGDKIKLHAITEYLRLIIEYNRKYLVCFI